MPPPRSKGTKLSDAFRRVALSMPGAVEGAHMGHADFRAPQIFATLNQNETLGVVMFTPEEQREFVQARPSVFVPVQGGWGAGGATHVHLGAADDNDLQEAISTAWRRIVTTAVKPRTVAKTTRTVAKPTRTVAKPKGPAPSK